MLFVTNLAGRRALRGGRLFMAALAVFVLFAGLARADREGGARVVRVYDGDTCRLSDGRVVRLAGVDAPEVAHNGAPAQYYAAASRDALARLVMGRAVHLVVRGDEGDRFGRVLGDFLLPEGGTAVEALSADGAVFVFWHRDLSEAAFERLLTLQRRAMAQGRGFWPQLLALPAPSRGYVGNAASKRFHAADCPEAARISPRNRVALPDLRQAFARGYSPARECTPWPTVGPVGPGVQDPVRNG
jgi:endonuclease YncB( thermonuclease family)